MPSPDARQWLSSLVLGTMAALYVVAGLSFAAFDPSGATANAKVNPALSTAPELAAPPKPEPLQFRDIPPQDALALNAAVPVSKLPNPAARAFAPGFASETDRVRALECLTAAVYYEAAVESTDGQRAVAQVVLNRVRHPAYPKTVCGVVFQGSERATGCQFTFTCDGALRRTPSAAGWARARAVAEQALAGKVYAPVGWATHYHTNWVVPYWSSSLVKAANVGTHIFYRWTGGWGRPGAFGRGRSGGEPAMALMAHLTSAPLTAEEAKETDAAAALAAAQNPDLTVAGSASVDSFQRAVLRRYEPMSREKATATAIARTGEPAAASLRWALGGERAAGPPAVPLGRKAETPPAPPRCLDGVRRAGAQGTAEKQTC
jgi:spore germination cell wall hydrolase CwlJ-like protein